MHDEEAVQMMNRCKNEILQLRQELDRLRPKAEAYENIETLLGLLPRPSRGMAPDFVWELEKRIRELTPPAKNPVE